eukprot:12138829-Heterocapsa_arctica.AAC.1
MGTAKLGGPRLDKVWTRRRRRRCGTRGGGRGLRRERDVDPEGEALSRGKFANKQNPQAVEKKDN